MAWCWLLLWSTQVIVIVSPGCLAFSAVVRSLWDETVGAAHRGDLITGAQAGVRRRGTGLDAGDEHPGASATKAGTAAPDLHAEERARPDVHRRGAVTGLDLVGDGERIVDRDGIPVGRATVGDVARRRRGVDPDDLTGGVEERPAGVPRLERGAGLDQVLEVLDVAAVTVDVDGRPSAVTVPSVTVGRPGLFKAFPIATTFWPTVTVEEFPRGTVASPDAPPAWRTAMSLVASVPTTVAL